MASPASREEPAPRRVGPRARRRLAWLVGAVAVVVVLGVVLGRVTGSGRPSAPRRQRIGAQSLGIPFGTSARQLLQKLGSPGNKQAGCWVYRADKDNVIDGIYAGEWVDAVKYCFAAGPAGTPVVMRINEHLVAHTIKKRKFPAGWDGLVILNPVPSSDASG
jgi:hypothetical protein